MKGWGFVYKTNIVWYKTRKDGGPDGRGVGFYFRNVTEMLLFGTAGKTPDIETGPAASQHHHQPESKSIRGSPVKRTRSWRRAAQDLTLNFSLGSSPPGWD